MNAMESNMPYEHDHQINEYYHAESKVRFPEEELFVQAEFDPFIQACEQDNFQFIDEYLLKNFNSKDENGYKNVTDRLLYLFPLWDLKVSIGELESIPLFLFACQFGTKDLVHWMATNQDMFENGEKLLDFKDDDGSNALHYACQGNHIEVVQYLMDRKFHINSEDKWGRLPIYFACKNEILSIEIILYLLCHGSLVDNIDKTGDGVIDIIVSYFDNERLQRMAVEDADYRKLKRCADEHIIEICYACLLNGHLGRRENASAIFKSIMKSDNLPLVSLAFLKYLPYLKNPITLLNAHFTAQDHAKLGEPDAEHELFMTAKTLTQLQKLSKKNEFSKWYTIFQQYLRYSPYQHMVLHYITQILYGLHVAMDKNPNEMSDLSDIRRKFEIMINEIFTSNALDSTENVGLLLLPFQFLQHPKTGLVHMNSIDNKFRDTFHDETSVIRLCLDYDIITLCILFFSKPSSTQLLFEQTYVYSIYSWSFYLLFENTSNLRRNEHASRGQTLSDLALATNAYTKKLRFTHMLPSIPAVVMFTEYISKTLLLSAVANLSLNGYGLHYQTDYTEDANPYNDPNSNDFRLNEYGLIALAVADLLFEIGQIFQQKRFSWKDQDEWNCLDVFSSSFILVWAVMRFATRQYFVVSRTLLALAAIPMSFGLLRYLSVYKPLGELVILIKAMGSAIFTFVIVYSFSIMGFGITFLSLFYQMTDAYSTPGFAFLALIQNTLLNFSFDDFITNSQVINTLGIILLLVFLILTALILMNLLIAQMSSSYNDMKAKSKKQWAFNFAKLAGQYVSNKEDQNLLCLFPPPFNLFGLILGIINIFTENNFQFSLGQTINNVCCSVCLGTFFRGYHNIRHFLSMLVFRIPVIAHDKGWSVMVTIGFYLAYTVLAIVLMVLDVFAPFYCISMEIYCLLRQPQIINRQEPSSVPANATAPGRLEPPKLNPAFMDTESSSFKAGISSSNKFMSRKQSDIAISEIPVFPPEDSKDVNAYRNVCLYLKFLSGKRIPLWKRIANSWVTLQSANKDQPLTPRTGSLLQTTSKWSVSETISKEYCENFALNDPSLEVFHLYEHSELLYCLDTEDDDSDTITKTPVDIRSQDQLAAGTATTDSAESDKCEKSLLARSNKSLLTSTFPSTERIFKNEDIERILHPLKSYIRSLGSDETIRLENNVAHEGRKMQQEIQDRLDDHLKKIVFIEKMMYSAFTGNHQVFLGSNPPTPTVAASFLKPNIETSSVGTVPTTRTPPSHPPSRIHEIMEMRRNDSIGKGAVASTSHSNNNSVSSPRYNAYNIPFLHISRGDSAFRSNSSIASVGTSIAAKSASQSRWQTVKIALKMKNELAGSITNQEQNEGNVQLLPASEPAPAESKNVMVDTCQQPHQQQQQHPDTAMPMPLQLLPDVTHLQHRMDKLETMISDIHSILSLMSQQKP